MPGPAPSAEPIVEIDGSPIADESGPQLAEVIVDSDLTAVDTCTITLLGTGGDGLEGVNYGSAVTVAAPSLSDGEQADLFQGEVYAIEFEADERATYSRIVAFDQSYRLKQHRVTASYISMTDSDIATQIANDLSLDVGTIEATSTVFEHVGQLNETHWDFLKARASAIDFDVFIQDGALHFRKPDEASGGPDPGGHEASDPLQLTAGRNLTRIRTRMSAAQQVSEIEVRGWDPVQKEVLVGVSPAETRSVELSQNAAGLAETMGSQKRVAGRAQYVTQAECDDLAASLAQRSASGFAYAEGSAFGDPRLKAGVAVAIGGTGTFDGQYTLTRSRHVFRAGDYSTRFWVSGNHDRSRYGMTAHKAKQAKWTGSYPAIVTNLQDPEQANRVKLRFPWLDDTYETHWSRVCQIGAGREQGLLWFPEVDDEVLVIFMGGDANEPVIIGSLFNGQDAPPFSDHIDHDRGTVEIRGMKSREGHCVALYDKSGEERIEIRTGDGAHSIVIDQANSSIVIDTSGDLSATAGGDVEVSAGGNVKVEASSNIEIEAGANCTIKAGGKLTLEGAMVEVTGQPIKLN